MKDFALPTQELKKEAFRLGFDACGISRADALGIEARRLEQWLREDLHGLMTWMENHFDKRTDPRKLVDGAQSIISVLHNYYQSRKHKKEEHIGKISRYAWGDDYHLIMKEKLSELYHWLDNRFGGISGRVFVDSAPVMDKVWAQRGGLGWIGKHTNLINRSLGSFFFIGELIVDVPLVPDEKTPDYCGTCRRCIDACPTGAIFQPYTVDANRCISYLTIEFRGQDIPKSLKPKVQNWIFGCDICQDVCPWNKFSQPATETRYRPRLGMIDTPLEEYASMNIDIFRKRFRKNPVKRSKFKGFKRNVRVALDNVPINS